jgi:hypothetical protein
MLLGCQSPCAKKANRHARREPPRLFISTKSSGPVSDTGAQAHESSSWAPVPGCREVKLPLAPVLRPLRAAAKDKKGELSKPMQRYQGTPRVAQQNHQVQRPRVSKLRGHA